MRDLSATLLAQQKTGYTRRRKPLCKIVLTKSGEDTQTYGLGRILDLKYPQAQDSQTAEVLLKNADGALTSLDLKGYQGVISKGATTSAGDEYSEYPPLWVLSQQLFSAGGQLLCHLSLTGIPNLMSAEKADADYTPDSDDTDTVKTLIRKICGDSGVSILDCYDHCKLYDVVFEGTDTLIDVFQPKDSFSIKVGETRWDKIKELLFWTQSVAIVKADGKVHIIVATRTGTTYDYEYKLLTPGEHTFFQKTVRERVVVPNYIEVKSHPSHENQYSGSAQIDGYDSLPDELKKPETRYLRVSSNAQATAIATAMLAHYEWDAETGHGFAPMNVGAEVHDYVKITDKRQGDTRTGNIGFLLSHYTPGKFEFEFRFGNILQTGLLGTMSPSATSGGAGVGVPDLSYLQDQINLLNNIIQSILSQLAALGEYTDRLLGYIYITQNGDIVLNPKYLRAVLNTGDLGMSSNKAFGLLLALTESNVKFYTKGGTLDHAFCPDSDGHGKVGTADFHFLEGRFKKMYVTDELYIPAEE